MTQRIRKQRLIAPLRGVERPDALVSILAAAGVGGGEVTLDTPGAPATIERLRARGDVGVVARCGELGLPVVPGAFTPTDVEGAWRAGAALVKLFPARVFGPAYVADLGKPLADVPLLCTGGVTAGNAADYLTAGAAAVGISFRPGTTEGEARQAVEAVASTTPAGEREEGP